MKTNIKEKQQKNTCQAIIITNRNKETKTKSKKRKYINKQKNVKRKHTTIEMYKKRSEIVMNVSY